MKLLKKKKLIFIYNLFFELFKINLKKKKIIIKNDENNVNFSQIKKINNPIQEYYFA